MQIANGIGISNAERMKQIGINSIEKLASSSVEDLIKIDGIGVNNAKMYIELAKKHLKSMRTRERIQSIIKKDKPLEVSRAETKACDLFLFGTNQRKVSLDLIKKLASSNVEDISRLKGIELSNAKRYINIANKYLESMRLKENGDDFVEIIPKLNKVSISSKLKIEEYPQKPAAKTQTPKRERQYQKMHNIDVKSTKRASYGIDVKTDRKKITARSPSILKTFFPLAKMQKIRFLHYKIKILE